MSRVLVLSGGGARGAWQAGCLRAMSGTYDAMLGVSVGAINAARVAQYRTVDEAARQLEFDWLNTSTGAVLGSWPAGALSSLVEGSLYHVEPLQRMLHKRLAERALIHPCAVFATSLATGALARLALTGDVRRDTQAILASAAFPTVMPSVEIEGDRFYDGGVVRVVPLVEALLEHHVADSIDVMLCADPGDSVPLAQAERGLRGLWRTVEIATHDRARTDLVQAKADWLEYGPRPCVRLFWPRQQWIADPMAFDPPRIEQALRQGYEDGIKGPQEVWQ